MTYFRTSRMGAVATQVSNRYVGTQTQQFQLGAFHLMRRERD